MPRLRKASLRRRRRHLVLSPAYPAGNREGDSAEDDRKARPGRSELHQTHRSVEMLVNLSIPRPQFSGSSRKR